VFDVDAFIADCVAAAAGDDPILAVRDVLERALARPADIEEALPATEAELTPLYATADLHIMKFVWGRGMKIPPHDHRMWAVNGIYGGEEDNAFFRRTQDGLAEAGGRSLATGDVAVLGSDVIHSVTNPRTRACTGSIHIYGGDFLAHPRSIWDPETREERPTDGAALQRLFATARERDRAADTA
jgi:predicted metal-dependent enzyme (double-stranded beta helix superfamily)